MTSREREKIEDVDTLKETIRMLQSFQHSSDSGMTRNDIDLLMERLYALQARLEIAE